MTVDFTRIATTVLRALKSTDADREKGTSFAVREALRELVEGDSPRGLASLDYAQRLAPSDNGITYAIGLVRLALGDQRATEPLELVLERTGWRDVLVHLAMARRRFGDLDRAAHELNRVLRANAPERSASFYELAGGVARDTQCLGWCGLDNAGRISIGGEAAQLSTRELDIQLDGKPVRFRALRSGPQRTLRMVRLLDPWISARRIAVFASGRPLIGSPIEIAQVTRVEGFVETTEAGGIAGWCWLPGERETAPIITIRSLDHPDQSVVLKAEQRLKDTQAFAPFAEPRQFLLDAERAHSLQGSLQVRGPHGRTLYGSPVRAHDTLHSAREAARAIADLFPADGSPPKTSAIGREPSIPADIRVQRPRGAKPIQPAPGIDVIIPVYRGLDVTLACIDSVLAARSLDERVVVVVDASPDAELVARLRALADTGAITLSLQTVNRGFPATANIGLRMAHGRDAVLLNSDTLVTPNWLERLRDTVYGAPDIGTATPLSNDATIFSYPRTDDTNIPPDLAEATQLAELAHATNAGVVVDVPTGHGFCMYIRAECLAETGVLREDVFAQGYGEENDFSMRARVFGWRHVAVPGAFVAHLGSQPFAATRTHLIARNLTTLNRLHVGYDQLVQEWLTADPLATSRRRLDVARFALAQAGRRSVLLVTHNRGGGVLRHVRERAAIHEDSGERALLLRPGRAADGTFLCSIEIEAEDSYPNLVFRLPDEIRELRSFLRAARVRLIELHHFIGHHEDVLRLVRDFGSPYDVYVHDYAWFCPRVTLTNGANRYCGEPAVTSCTSCVADHGNNIDEAITPAELRARSSGLLLEARSVVAPSWDTARRIERHFGVEVEVGVWEPKMPGRPVLRALPEAPRRVLVLGAIGMEKGYATLLGAARFAAEHRMPIEFVVVGYTCDDRRLLETGKVRITGRYQEPEAASLIRAQAADCAFLPALWPETWSYVMSQLWEAGLPVVAYDIGAPAERIRAAGGGIVVPLNMPAGKLVEMFLDPKLFLRGGAKGRQPAAPIPMPPVAMRGETAMPMGLLPSLDAYTESVVVRFPH